MMTKTPEPGSRLVFHKMHGAGNDFILLDLRQQELNLTPELASRMADRRLGIGCDQLLLVYPSGHEDCLARYEIRNADGSEAGQCGNGARCIALYLNMLGEIDQGSLLLESPSGPVEIECCADGEFEVNMGEPKFEPEDVPISIKPEQDHYSLSSPRGPVTFSAASMGNPHALVLSEKVDDNMVHTVWAFIGTHAAFPEGCNVGFGKLENRATLYLRVFERGAGETLACGSGACAAVAMLRRAGKVDEVVNVFLPGGHLVIKWLGAGAGVKMKGPATYVFRGSVLDE